MRWTVYRLVCFRCGPYEVALKGRRLPTECRCCQRRLDLSEWKCMGEVEAPDEMMAIFLVGRRRRIERLRAEFQKAFDTVGRSGNVG